MGCRAPQYTAPPNTSTASETTSHTLQAATSNAYMVSPVSKPPGHPGTPFLSATPQLTRNKASCRLPSALMSSPVEKSRSHMSHTSGYSSSFLASSQHPLLPQDVLTHTPGEVRPVLCLVGAEDGQAPVLLHLPTAINRGCSGRERRACQ